MISVRKAKQLDATTMLTYSHANAPLGQSERVYYLSYFIKVYIICAAHWLGFLSRFGLKMGIHFAHCGLESGMVFEGTTECMNVLILSIPNE